MPGDAIHRTDILGAVIELWHGMPFTLLAKRPVADVPEHVLAQHVGVCDSRMGRLRITLTANSISNPKGQGAANR